jgi:hypothetical protein
VLAERRHENGFRSFVMGQGGYPVLSIPPDGVNDATPKRAIGSRYKWKHGTHGWITVEYVLLDGAASATVGMCALQSDQAAVGRVTIDKNGDALGKLVRGVFLGSVTYDQYGFIQIRESGVGFTGCGDGSIAAGEWVKSHASTDGDFDTAVQATTSSDGPEICGMCVTADATASGDVVVPGVWL